MLLERIYFFEDRIKRSAESVSEQQKVASKSVQTAYIKHTFGVCLIHAVGTLLFSTLFGNLNSQPFK